MLALALGATFVARGFSGDKDAARAADQGGGRAPGRRVHRRRVSPCVAFNNHPGSTKSYDYVREHNEAVNRLDFMPVAREITTSYAPAGDAQTSCCTTAAPCACASCTPTTIRATRSRRWPTSRRAAPRGEVVTGLLYVDADSADLHDAQNTVDAPLNALADAELVPGSAALAAFNASLR